MPAKKKPAARLLGYRTDVASKVVFTITSGVGDEDVKATLEFDPPLPGPAKDDQRRTPAQALAERVVEALSDIITGVKPIPKGRS